MATTYTGVSLSGRTRYHLNDYITQHFVATLRPRYPNRGEGLSIIIFSLKGFINRKLKVQGFEALNVESSKTYAGPS